MRGKRQESADTGWRGKKTRNHNQISCQAQVTDFFLFSFLFFYVESKLEAPSRSSGQTKIILPLLKSHCHLVFKSWQVPAELGSPKSPHKLVCGR